MIHSLPFDRFLQLRNLLLKARNREVREKFILSAFLGWQMGAGASKKFGEYLEGLGLLGEQVPTELTPRADELDAKAAIAKAEEILKMAGKKDKEQG